MGAAETSDASEARMRQILAEMSVISEQRARTYDGPAVHGGERNHAPSLTDKPLLDFWRDRYNRASGETRRLVVEGAEAALKNARVHVTLIQSEEPERFSFVWKCQVADATGDVKDVAAWYEINQRTVVRYRQRYTKLLTAPRKAC